LGKIHDALIKSDKESKASDSTDKASMFKVYDRKAREKASSGAIKTVFKSRDVNENVVSLLEPQSFESEQFKHLRTNILFPVSGKPPPFNNGNQCCSWRGKVFRVIQFGGKHCPEY